MKQSCHAITNVIFPGCQIKPSSILSVLVPKGALKLRWMHPMFWGRLHLLKGDEPSYNCVQIRTWLCMKMAWDSRVNICHQRQLAWEDLRKEHPGEWPAKCLQLLLQMLDRGNMSERVSERESGREKKIQRECGVNTGGKKKYDYKFIHHSKIPDDPGLSSFPYKKMARLLLWAGLILLPDIKHLKPDRKSKTDQCTEAHLNSRTRPLHTVLQYRKKWFDKISLLLYNQLHLDIILCNVCFIFAYCQDLLGILAFLAWSVCVTISKPCSPEMPSAERSIQICTTSTIYASQCHLK